MDTTLPQELQRRIVDGGFEFLDNVYASNGIESDIFHDANGDFIVARFSNGIEYVDYSFLSRTELEFLALLV